MNIRDLQINQSRPDHLRSSASGEAGKVQEAAPVQPAQPVESQQQARDRVEISDAARAAANEPQVEGINFARKALLGIPPLSDERASDMIQRIQEGYYSQPEVLKQVATGVAGDLTGSSGTP